MVEKIDLNNLDKTRWESFRFEDIAKRISEPVDPNTTFLEKYVGLEHIDAENIHINRFGTPDDVSGGKLKCYPGDVIFGKRRAYQRKAAVVDFEGICSAHAFVLRANPEVIEPKLFPFFLHSDQFMHRAVDISVGGLSPTINWGDLKHQEFLLPPKAEQARLAELLWAMDEVIEKEKVVLEKLEVSYKSFRRNEIDNLAVEKKKISDLLSNQSEINVGKIEKSNYQFKGKYPIIDQSVEFIIGYTDNENLVFNGELPIVIFGDHTTILKFIDFPFVMGADGTKVLKPTSNINVKYFFQALTELNIKPQGYRRHYSLLRNEKIKVPTDTNWVRNFVNKIDYFLESINTLNSKLSSSQSLQKSLINQIF